MKYQILTASLFAAAALTITGCHHTDTPAASSVTPENSSASEAAASVSESEETVIETEIYDPTENESDDTYAEITDEELENLTVEASDLQPDDTTPAAGNSDDVSSIVRISNISDYISLCDFSGMTATRTAQAVSDYDLELRMLQKLSLYDTYEKTDQDAAYGNRITMRLAIKEDDTVLNQWDDHFFLTIGDALFGYEFDTMIIGHKAGDDFSFVITYPETFLDEEWAGKDITFEGSILAVEEVIPPVITDEIVDENTPFESVSDYREYIRQKMQKEYSIAADTTLRTMLLDRLVSESTISGYPQELYDRCRTDIDQDYDRALQMYGNDQNTDSAELEQAKQNETLRKVYQRLVISAIFTNEPLTLSKTECHDILITLSTEYGYETLNAFIEDLHLDTEQQIWLACERKAGDYLIHHMHILDNILDYSLEDLEVPLDPDADAEEIIVGLSEGGVYSGE